MTTLSRNMLAKFFGSEPRVLAAFEDLSRKVDETSDAATVGAAATDALQDATVIVLSANAALNNERILRLASGLKAVDDGTFVTISAPGFVVSKGFQATLIPPGKVTLVLPPEGTIATDENPKVPIGRNYATDAAAATGGVAVGGLYHNAGTVRVRLT